MLNAVRGVHVDENVVFGRRYFIYLKKFAVSKEKCKNGNGPIGSGVAALESPLTTKKEQT